MDRVVVITGVTRGLGRAMALGFAKRGWKVAGCGRDGEELVEVTNALSGHLIMQADVTRPGSLANFARAVLDQLGPPDLLINNAAVISPNAPLWEVTTEDFSRVMDINVRGTYEVCRRFLPPMIGRGSGVVVNMSSGWGRSTSPEVAPYCASKWAIEGMTRALAQELPEGMAAVPLNPGVIDTAMLRSCWGQEAEAYPTPEEWAESAVPFLEGLGPENNGEALTVPS